ncbi:MAG: RidA family protein [Acidobacteria bacterium]|nr:RidA family protein [Acidobacteriota bacterium]MBP8274460.1 RidA family protein [Acidobacteriota bacterium]
MKTASLAALALLACVATSGVSAQSASRRYIEPKTPETTGAPFSGAVMVGDTLYLSGHLGAGANNKPETAEAEAKAMLDAFKATLTKAGMTMDDLVSVQIFASNTADYAAFNTVYRGYFTKEFPARAFIGSGPLLFGARFEIQGIAVKR